MAEAGTKRARTSSGQSLPQAEYLEQLKVEQTRLQAIGNVPHCLAWLESEIERVSSGRPTIGAEPRPGYVKPTLPWERADDSSEIKAVLVTEDKNGPNVKSTMRIYIPSMSHPSGQPRPQTSRGLLLGPSGSTLKSLQAESRCRIKIRGKGSGTEHKNTEEPEDELHVSVDYEGPGAGRDSAFIYIDNMVRTILAGGHLSPMPRPELYGYNPVTPYGSAAPPPVQTVEQMMRSTEQAFLSQAIAEGQIVSVVSSYREMGGRCQTTVKVYVPVRCNTGCSRGKLLGNRGNTLKTIAAECGCKLAIRGKGSSAVPAGETEDSLAASNPALHGHLKEEMHVLVEYEGMVHLKDLCIQRAEALIKNTLFPERYPDVGGFSFQEMLAAYGGGGMDLPGFFPGAAAPSPFAPQGAPHGQPQWPSAAAPPAQAFQVPPAAGIPPFGAGGFGGRDGGFGLGRPGGADLSFGGRGDMPPFPGGAGGLSRDVGPFGGGGGREPAFAGGRDAPFGGRDLHGLPPTYY